MKDFQKKFITRLLIISVALYTILYFIFSKLIVASLPLVAMMGLLFAVSALAMLIITNTKEKKPKNFVYSYMGVSLGRLLLCGGYVFIYALFHRQAAVTFAVTFFILYLLYTYMEVRAIYTFFKS